MPKKLSDVMRERGLDKVSVSFADGRTFEFERGTSMRTEQITGRFDGELFEERWPKEVRPVRLIVKLPCSITNCVVASPGGPDKARFCKADGSDLKTDPPLDQPAITRAYLDEIEAIELTWDESTPDRGGATQK